MIETNKKIKIYFKKITENLPGGEENQAELCPSPSVSSNTGLPGTDSAGQESSGPNNVTL